MKLKIHYFTEIFAIRNPLKLILLKKCPMGLNYYEFFLWLHTLYLLRLNKEFVSSDNGAHANFKMHKYPPTFTDRHDHHRWVQPVAAPMRRGAKFNAEIQTQASNDVLHS